MRAMRRKKLGLAAAIIATGLMTVAPSATAVSVPAASPATACATVYWGSLTKTVSTHARSTSVDDVRAFYEAKVPMGRGCLPADLARAIMYIAEQSYETGQALPVTGGQNMLN